MRKTFIALLALMFLVAGLTPIFAGNRQSWNKLDLQNSLFQVWVGTYVFCPDLNVWASSQTYTPKMAIYGGLGLVKVSSITFMDGSPIGGWSGIPSGNYFNDVKVSSAIYSDNGATAITRLNQVQIDTTTLSNTKLSISSGPQITTNMNDIAQLKLDTATLHLWDRVIPLPFHELYAEGENPANLQLTITGGYWVAPQVDNPSLDPLDVLAGAFNYRSGCVIQSSSFVIRDVLFSTVVGSYNSYARLKSSGGTYLTDKSDSTTLPEETIGDITITIGVGGVATLPGEYLVVEFWSVLESGNVCELDWGGYESGTRVIYTGSGGETVTPHFNDSIDVMTMKIVNVADPVDAQDADTKVARDAAVGVVNTRIDTLKLNGLPAGADGNINANNQKIINVLDPSDNQDAATKKWVDDLALWDRTPPVVNLYASGDYPDSVLQLIPAGATYSTTGHNSVPFKFTGISPLIVKAGTFEFRNIRLEVGGTTGMHRTFSIRLTINGNVIGDSTPVEVYKNSPSTQTFTVTVSSDTSLDISQIIEVDVLSSGQGNAVVKWGLSYDTEAGFTATSYVAPHFVGDKINASHANVTNVADPVDAQDADTKAARDVAVAILQDTKLSISSGPQITTNMNDIAQLKLDTATLVSADVNLSNTKLAISSGDIITANIIRLNNVELSTGALIVLPSTNTWTGENTFNNKTNFNDCVTVRGGSVTISNSAADTTLSLPHGTNNSAIVNMGNLGNETTGQILYNDFISIMTLSAGNMPGLDIARAYCKVYKDFRINPLYKFYLDNGVNTYITESADNVIDVYAGGVKELTINSSGVSTPGSLSVGSFSNVFITSDSFNSGIFASTDTPPGCVVVNSTFTWTAPKTMTIYKIKIVSPLTSGTGTIAISTGATVSGSFNIVSTGTYLSNSQETINTTMAGWVGSTTILEGTIFKFFLVGELPTTTQMIYLEVFYSWKWNQ